MSRFMVSAAGPSPQGRLYLHTGLSSRWELFMRMSVPKKLAMHRIDLM
jgi:hypothetical protein